MSHSSGNHSGVDRLQQSERADRGLAQRPLEEQVYQFSSRDGNGAAYQARDHRQPLHPAVREPSNLSEYSNLVDRRRILEPKALETSTSASERLKLKQQGMDRWRSDQRNPAYNKQEVYMSPIRPYAADSSTSSPLRNQTAKAAVSLSMIRPSVDSAGELFNYEPSANLPAKEICYAFDSTTLPFWTASRPYLNGKFLYSSRCIVLAYDGIWEWLIRPDAVQSTSQSEGVSQDVKPLGSHPRLFQDSLIVDDLLNTFLGVDGTYITARLVRGMDGVHVVYTLEGEMDISLKELASRMLPLSEYAALMERFADTRSSYEWGLVCHAFSAAVREILEDWRLLVTQLEHQHLTSDLNLQGLWYHCQKPLATLHLVASLAGEAAAGQLRGAAVLNLLDQKLETMAGDADAVAVLQRLLSSASRPYFEMLEGWLCKGILDDPYAEFMVREDKAVALESVNDNHESAYWTDRYVLRMTRPANLDVSHESQPEVPQFLESCQDAILATGKYLNIVRACGREVERPLASGTHLVYDGQQRYLQMIAQANKHASEAMMKLMQVDADLLTMLQAIKNFFLVDRGDIITSFLDTAEDEMSKPKDDVSLPRLQTLLELAVRSCTGAAAVIADELFCTIDARGLQPMLHDLRPNRRGGRKLKASVVTPLRGADESHEDDSFTLSTQVGREVFMLGFKVSWPASLVLSKGAICTYQLIFRHLFELKCVERELNKVWKIYQQARLVFEDSKGGLKTAFGLCQRMMHFFQQYLLYVTFEVLEPYWLALHKAVRESKSLDEIMEHHRKFLQRALSGTVLKSKIIRTLNQLKAMVYSFSRESAPLDVAHDGSYTEAPRYRRPSSGVSLTQQRHQKLASGKKQILSILEETDYASAVGSLDRKFTSTLAAFITGLENVHQGLVVKPDPNRDEVDSLQRLITRLDFNGYFASAQQHLSTPVLSHGDLQTTKVF